MSIPNDCCSPCASVQTVNVPGPQGAGGTNGTNGTNGTSAYSIAMATNPGDLTAGTIPAVGSDVPLKVSSTLWMVVGQIVIIGPQNTPSRFHAVVKTIVSTSSVVVTALGYYGDAANPTTIPLNAVVAPAGIATSGTKCLAFAYTDVSPAATGSDQTLATVTIPATLFNASGCVLEVEGVFTLTSAVAGHNKTIKLILGSSTVFTTGVLAAATGIVLVRIRIMEKSGPAAQRVYAAQSVNSAAAVVVNEVYAPADFAENLIGGIAVKFTGNSAITAGDLVLNSWSVYFRGAP